MEIIKPYIYLRTLGAVKIFFRSNWHLLPSTKETWLIIYLAYHASWINREELANLFWSELPNAKNPSGQARTNLRNLLFRLRKKYEWLGLEFDGDKIRLRIAVDVHYFALYLQEKQYRSALTIYRGKFLEKCQCYQNNEFTQWQNSKANNLEHNYHIVNLNRYASLLEDAQYTYARNIINQYLRDEFFGDIALQGYMLTNYYLGSWKIAEKTFKKERLRGIPHYPTQATQDLFRHLKNQDVESIKQAQTKHLNLIRSL